MHAVAKFPCADGGWLAVIQNAPRRAPPSSNSTFLASGGCAVSAIGGPSDRSLAENLRNKRASNSWRRCHRALHGSMHGSIKMLCKSHLKFLSRHHPSTRSQRSCMCQEVCRLPGLAAIFRPGSRRDSPAAMRAKVSEMHDSLPTFEMHDSLPTNSFRSLYSHTEYTRLTSNPRMSARKRSASAARVSSRFAVYRAPMLMS